MTAAVASGPVPLVSPVASAAAPAAAPTVCLRTALVWQGEVMADRVSHVPEPIMLEAPGAGRITSARVWSAVVRALPYVAGAAATGVLAFRFGTLIQLLWALVWAAIIVPVWIHSIHRESPGFKFAVPDLDLPADFAIIRPGNRGYLLTLGARMRGTISVEGREREVADFVRRGGEGGVGATEDAEASGASAFRATAIGSRDWGVVDLDPEGNYQLFFQFVLADAPLAKRRPQLELLLPALAFSLLLHTVMLAVTYQFDDDLDDISYPSEAELTGRFLINRMKDLPPPPEPPKAAVMASPAADHGKVLKVASATKGREGKAGGQGDLPRARDPDALDTKALAPTAPKVLFMQDKNRAVLDNVISMDVRTDLSRYTGLPGPRQRGGLGQGHGTGTGFGDDQGGTGNTRGSTGDGPGAGGALEADQVSHGKIDPGETRPASGHSGHGSGGLKETGLVATGNAEGDFGGLTKEEIDRVVKSRSGLIKTCYQRELDHSAGLGGKLVISFTISAGGDVTRAKADGGKSTLHNAEVEDCVTRQIQRLKFPAKGGGFVNYPFIFSQG
ncbi:MAG TPA: AgmX/PglI C-terminal domain-containing protein [Kofleriaceae bacterium]|nr:AgmX/PglI C-terminal domain-containing protein [Kofleriaceae bacterium]